MSKAGQIFSTALLVDVVKAEGRATDEGLAAWVADLGARDVRTKTAADPSLSMVGGAVAQAGARCPLLLSRCSVWFDGFVGGADVSQAPVPTLDFELVADVGGAGVVAARGTLAPAAGNATGLVVQCSGLLAQRWLLSVAGTLGAAPASVRAHFLLCVDRLGAGAFSLAWGNLVAVPSRGTDVG